MGVTVSLLERNIDAALVYDLDDDAVTELEDDRPDYTGPLKWGGNAPPSPFAPPALDPRGPGGLLGHLNPGAWDAIKPHGPMLMPPAADARRGGDLIGPALTPADPGDQTEKPGQVHPRGAGTGDAGAADLDILKFKWTTVDPSGDDFVAPDGSVRIDPSGDDVRIRTIDAPRDDDWTTLPDGTRIRLPDPDDAGRLMYLD